MSRCTQWTVIVSAALTMLAACHDASAQYRGPRRRARRPSVADQPTVSPYINLVNPNVNVGQSYVGIVAPLVQQQETGARNAQAIRTLQRSFDDATTANAYGGVRRIGPTGHHATYMNFSHFYGGGAGGDGSGFSRRSSSSSSYGGIGTGGFGMGMGGMGMF